MYWRLWVRNFAPLNTNPTEICKKPLTISSCFTWGKALILRDVALHSSDYCVSLKQLFSVTVLGRAWSFQKYIFYLINFMYLTFTECETTAKAALSPDERGKSTVQVLDSPGLKAVWREMVRGEFPFPQSCVPIPSISFPDMASLWDRVARSLQAANRRQGVGLLEAGCLTWGFQDIPDMTYNMIRK